MLNAFHPPIKVDTVEDIEFAEAMLERYDMPNLLHEHLVEQKLIRHTKQWKEISSESLADFPRLSLIDLRRLTLGVYQIKLAPSYMADANEEGEGDYDIRWHEEVKAAAIRFKLQSRFRASVKHYLWLGYNPANEGWRSITGWYCKCENGSRIVGCCAHIASILWYFGYARYLPRVQIPKILTHAQDASAVAYDNEAVDIDDGLNIFDSDED